MRAIDPWVNVRVAGFGWQKQVAGAVFKRPPEDIFRNYTSEELIGMMDPLGIEKAILGINAEAPEANVLKFASDHPERFAFAAQVDPRRGMKPLRAIEALARSQPLVAVRVLPCLFDIAPDDRVYYPLYAKSVELGLPVCVTTGIPGPPLPGKSQD